MKRISGWTVRGSLSLLAVLCSNVSLAQLKAVDHGEAAIDSHGLMWANTVGINLSWNQAGGAGTAQAFIANLNATDFGGYNNWTLPTGNFAFGANATSNQLGELFYTDCGNVVGTQTVLSAPGKNCGALSTLKTAIQAGTNGLSGDINISSSTPLPPDPFTAWEIYSTSSSQQRAWDADSVNFGVTGEGDVLAVRRVVGAPEFDFSFAATGLTLLFGLLAVLRGTRKTTVYTIA